MSDSPKASVENKKVDTLNNEISADVKTAPHEVVIPIKETKEEKTDAPKVTDFTITNSEVMTGGCVHPSFQSPLSRP